MSCNYNKIMLRRLINNNGVGTNDFMLSFSINILYFTTKATRFFTRTAKNTMLIVPVLCSTAYGGIFIQPCILREKPCGLCGEISGNIDSR
jgi:hypothetical protein